MLFIYQNKFFYQSNERTNILASCPQRLEKTPHQIIFNNPRLSIKPESAHDPKIFYLFEDKCEEK